MDANDFTYWLQGFFELTDANNLTENQVKIIKEHLKLVFKKETLNISPKEDLLDFSKGWGLDLSEGLKKSYEEHKKKENISITYHDWLEQFVEKQICKNPLEVILQPEKGICTNKPNNTLLCESNNINNEKCCEINKDYTFMDYSNTTNDNINKVIPNIKTHLSC